MTPAAFDLKRAPSGLPGRGAKETLKVSVPKGVCRLLLHGLQSTCEFACHLRVHSEVPKRVIEERIKLSSELTLCLL